MKKPTSATLVLEFTKIRSIRAFMPGVPSLLGALPAPLYETLSADCILVIIDTNMRLPDLGNMKWEEFSVIVPCSQLHQIGEFIQTFHSHLSDEEFARVSQKSRAAFEYILPQNFIMRSLQQLGLISNQQNVLLRN